MNPGNEIIDLVQKEDDYVLNYEQIAKDMPGVSQETRTIATLVEFIIRRIKPPLDIVDLGCGTGFVCEQVYRNSIWSQMYGFTLIDISRENLLRAPSNFTRIRADIEQMHLQKEVADVVICTDVLEHVRHPSWVINHAHSMLRPLGKLIVSFPWEQDISMIYSDPRYKKKYKYVHLRKINEEFVVEHFKGFTILSWTTITNQYPFQKIQTYPIVLYYMEKTA